MTFISWFSDIGLYLEDYLMYKAGTLAGGIREPLLTCSSFLCVKTAVSRGFIGQSINQQTSYDFGILRQDDRIVKCLPMNQMRFADYVTI